MTDPMRPNQPQPYAPIPPEPSVPGQPAPTPSMAPVAGGPVTPAAPLNPVPPKRRSGAWLNVVLVLAAAVAIGGVAFAVGRSTAPASAAAAGGGGRFFGNGGANGEFPNASGNPGFGGGQGGGFGGRLGAGGITVSGTVQSVDGDVLTVKTASGQTVQFSLGSSTTYRTASAGTASDVKTGSQVEVKLDLGNGNGGGFRQGQGATASGAPSGPIGTAGTVTVTP